MIYDKLFPCTQAACKVKPVHIHIDSLAEIPTMTHRLIKKIKFLEVSSIIPSYAK